MSRPLPFAIAGAEERRDRITTALLFAALGFMLFGVLAFMAYLNPLGPFANLVLLPVALCAGVAWVRIMQDILAGRLL